MNERTYKTLEFFEILKIVSQLAFTKPGKESIESLRPVRNIKAMNRWHEEVKEAVAILNTSGNIPIHTLEDVTDMLEQGKKGMFIRANQFSALLSFLDHCTKLKRFMQDKEIIAPIISLYASSISDLSRLEEDIHQVIRHGQVDDYASKNLAKIRKQIQTKQSRLKERTEAQAKKYKTIMQEPRPVEKDGRWTLPIKRENRNKIKGGIVDQSASGATLFVEPEELANLQEELQLLRMNEEHEVEQILYTMTAEVLDHESELNLAMETMHEYDVIFAKGKYSRMINGTAPEFSEDFTLRISMARHPMLGEKAVPLSIQMNSEDQALLITGPNTGGKTVTLKTVGLLCLMAQSGLPIPAEKGSVLPVFQQIFVDIGDGQSIEENLSTFSSRLVNLIDILREANDHSMLLLDEIGSGTDPGEGMGLATAILDKLSEKGATILATTHYSEMKEYARHKPGFMNGAMEFDLETLKPTYRLLLGTSGRSQAFDIAHKLGLHPEILNQAYSITYKQEGDFQVSDQKLKETEYKRQAAVNRYRRGKTPRVSATEKPHFQMGDNVIIQATGETAIVYKGPDQTGNYVVQVKGEKFTYNHKRLKLHIRAEDLYPEDYDFDIIFKSKEYRKVRKQLDRKHVEGLILEEED
ncbi:DNA mismatch repair protein [Halobacillus halophilus]|uniref:DNA mismatch repair protein MutS n=1 Tax=Halobacillus halophilus (strain ATCC 35676 / DSM 2266 / JCM 20832 / KCTC 3685 / LMG 17431 / NBRC 102448 / NCIMB 2269) TaxID=866895 RepID=I0JJG0_HALH3|nr:DNA mismatch repair protein [Halobacillus halophilus]ASF38437.1 DNA mismatch repair protein [Halobacillus halophilus]CCG44278.1 DNA mismatch repair protein MutS [Halobacillus halophilus DSM 2266]